MFQFHLTPSHPQAIKHGGIFKNSFMHHHTTITVVMFWGEERMDLLRYSNYRIFVLYSLLQRTQGMKQTNVKVLYIIKLNSVVKCKLCKILQEFFLLLLISLPLCDHSPLGEIPLHLYCQINQANVAGKDKWKQVITIFFWQFSAMNSNV